MKGLFKVPDDLLTMIREKVPDSPFYQADCKARIAENSGCGGCEHYPRCCDLISGIEIGAKWVGGGPVEIPDITKLSNLFRELSHLTLAQKP